MRFGCKEKAKPVNVTTWHLYYTWMPVTALSGDNEECRVMFEMVWRRGMPRDIDGARYWEYHTVEYSPVD